MSQCTAKSKRSGVQCLNSGMPNGTCHMHGGKTPRGICLPQFVHGRYSKDLPSRLAARYEQARTDPDLLSLRDQIALVDAFIGELVSQLTSGDQGPLMRDIGVQVDRSRALRDSESKRLTQMQQMISAEQASVLLGAVVHIVMTALHAHVSDDKQRRVIYADISRSLESKIGTGIVN